MSSKRKITSKRKKISKMGFVTQAPKYTDVFLLEKGKIDKTVKARFTNEEIKTLKARSRKYSAKIDKTDVGTLISNSEWERIDERVNWDQYVLITKSGKKIKLLATFHESNRGIGRADPNWKKRKKKVKEIPGQTRLSF